LSSAQLAQAARIPVVRENGVRVQFGELWRLQRTVAVFIRHFWYTHFFVLLAVLNYITSRRCPMCQDYLASLMRDVDHAALARTGVRLIVIGCGSYGLIRSYRRAHYSIAYQTVSHLMIISQKYFACPTRFSSTRRQGRYCTTLSAWATSRLAHIKRASRQSMRQDHTYDTAQ
jgi:hypothetical protein